MIDVGRENDASKAVRQMCSYATLQDVLGGERRVKVAEGMRAMLVHDVVIFVPVRRDFSICH